MDVPSNIITHFDLTMEIHSNNITHCDTGWSALAWLISMPIYYIK